MKRVRVAALALAVLTLHGAAGAQGADIERAKASFRAGANAYAAGDYPAAIQALEAAYELTPLPAIAFSLAQAERKQYAQTRRAEHLERAVKLFRRYLAEAPQGPRRADAELAIKELLAQVESSVSPALPPPAKALARPTRLMIVSDTPGARISVDGGAASPSPLIREVAPGRHRVRVRAPGHHEVVRDVTAVAGELLLNEVRLTELPTSLYVWAPEGADVYVDGVWVGQGGGLLTVPLAAGLHQLSVAQKGKRLVRRDIKLHHAQARTEYVVLEPTTQRAVSELLFIGAGAALGASLPLSAFAVRSENTAEKFLIQLSRQGDAVVGRRELVGGSDLVAYHASIVERNRFRTATIISAAASLGMFVTGLFLHELDQPSSPGTSRRDWSPPFRLRRPASSFELAPRLARGDLGASLKVSF